MTIEVANYIAQLQPTYPEVDDLVSRGDDHLRLIKAVLKNTFPNLTGPVTVTQTEINYLAGVTSPVEQTGNKNQPGGYAGLDGSGQIDQAQLPLNSGTPIIFITPPIFPGDQGNGIPPFYVSSNVLVDNLNSDMLDGFHAKDFMQTGVIPGGTVMVFYQAAAPVGWTLRTDLHDKVLRVVGAIGGGVGGSWNIDSLCISETVLTSSMIPLHKHFVVATGTVAIPSNGGPAWTPTGHISALGSSDGSYAYELSNSAGEPTIGLTSNPSEAGGAGHSHEMSSKDTWRPAYVDVILASKDAYPTTHIEAVPT